MINKKHYITIFAVIVISFLLVKLIANEVFIAGTPKIRPNLDKYLASRINNFIQDKKNQLASLFVPKPSDVLKNIPLQKISNGIYAKEKNNMSYTLIKENEVEWVEYTFDVNGKQVKIKIPKDQAPPPKEILENLQ